MIEGTVESLNEHGLFTGWLRDTEDPDPVMVEVRYEGRLVAQAVAASFRADLLRGAHGHGHYGFRAQIAVALPPSAAHAPALFELFLPRHGQGVRTRLQVPQLNLARGTNVEQLLRAELAWTAPDLLPHLACLSLPRHHAAMGTARFIDCAYRFALSRWPSRAERQVYSRALQEGGLSAEAFMAELLASRERQDLQPALASPWDATFPFAAPVPVSPISPAPINQAGTVTKDAP